MYICELFIHIGYTCGVCVQMFTVFLIVRWKNKNNIDLLSYRSEFILIFLVL